MIENILFLNKPSGCSSFDCIRHLKKILPKRTKIGHAGTLDPFATGLLIIAIGRGATKHLSTFMGLPKTYVATAQLNRVTDTLDHTGTVVATSTDPCPTRDQLHTALTSFGSSYTQTPPAYSALKHQGTPLYSLARTGKMSSEDIAAIAQTKQRTVKLYEYSLDNYDDKLFTVTARVSQGTYIRTFMHDIAQKAGSIGATTTALHREAIGPFNSQHAITIKEVSSDTLEQLVIPINEVLCQL